MPPNNHKLSVVVGMSGGVDSAVAAYLLKQQGFKVTGVFMKNWEEEDNHLSGYCSAAQDLKDAQDVCAKLNIELYKINFAAEYWDQVFEVFIREYKLGRTPNPDILCNTEIKFKAFLDYAKYLKADFIATGHYVRTVVVSNEILLLTSKDQTKDQSYFLHGLTQAQLSHSIFPLGSITKTEVRKIAKDLGLNNFNKKDSTGICFIGERNFMKFLSQYLPLQPGDIVDENNKIIGSHQGICFYTIGQRKGLNIGGRADNFTPEPWYVVAKNMADNNLIVVRGKHHPKLYHKSLSATNLHWINQRVDSRNLTCTAKIRYRQIPQECYLENCHTSNLIVHFKEPQRAITPGQYIVFYQQEQCLGGAIINHPI